VGGGSTVSGLPFTENTSAQKLEKVKFNRLTSRGGGGGYITTRPERKCDLDFDCKCVLFLDLGTFFL